MVEHLLANGFAVSGVDDFSTGKPENMALSRGKFDFIEGTLCDPAVAAKALEGVTRVIHLASIPSVPRSIDNPLENMHSSVTSTVTLFSEAARRGVQRIVQASSSAVYGDGEALPKTEDMLPNALSPYAAAKMAQEHYGTAFANSLGLDVASMRYFNVFGPRQDPNSEYAAVIPKFITLMLAGKTPTIFGDGGQTRDFIHVENVVAANLAAALHPEPLRGDVFNVASAERIDLNALAGRIARLIGVDIEAKHGPARSGEVRHSVASIDKIARVLGFSPAVDFDEGLRRTIESFRA
jgi:UDP-glucose 4-epimerase